MSRLLSVPAITGEIRGFAGTVAPSGWLLCDGAAVSRSTYAKLFGVIGTTYGAGDGSSTFNVPNLSGRVPVGKGGNYATAGATGGATAQTPSGSVGNTTLSTAQMPSHSHPFGYPVDGYPDASSSWINNSLPWGSTGSAGGNGAHNHGLSMNAMSVEQPFAVIGGFILKA